MKRTKTTNLLLVIFALILHFKGVSQYADRLFLTGENISNFSIAQSPDRYTVAGTMTNANGRHEIVVINYDLQGVIQWSRTFNEATNSRAMHIERVSDGFAVTGWAREAGGNNQLVFLRLDDLGNVLINEKYSDANRPDWSLTGQHVLELDNGDGYLLTGYSIEIGFQLSSPKSAFAMRIDAQGNRLWSKYYDTPNDGDSDFDMAAFSMAVPDGFFITGSLNLRKTSGATNQGVLLLKIDDQGNLIWQNGYGLDTDDRWDENFDLGTSALYDRGEIVVVANSTLRGGFNLVKVNPTTGFIVSAHHDFHPVDEENIASFSIAKSTWGTYIIGGMIPESATVYDCNDVAIEFGTVSFICELSSDLNNVIRAKKYMMHNPDFAATEGSIYNSHFSGPAGLNRPVIATPEMMCVDPNSYKVALLAYAQDRTLGAGHYDLQFIATDGPDFEWCSTRDLIFDLNYPSAVYSDDVKDEDVRTMLQDQSFTVNNLSLNTSACMLGNGSFPIRIEEVGTRKSVSAARGRTLLYQNQEVYVMGGHAGCTADVSPYVEKFDVSGSSLFEIKSTVANQTLNGLTGIQVDNSKNIYLCGGINPGSITWDNAPTIVAPVPVSFSSRTGYMLKYDANGGFDWQLVGYPAQSMGGAMFSIQDFQLAPNGFIYAVGVASGYVSFETYQNGVTTTSGLFFSFNGLDAKGFLMKINPSNGQVLAVKYSSSADPTLFDNYIIEQIEIDPGTNELFAVGAAGNNIRVTHFDSNLGELAGAWLKKEVPAPTNAPFGTEVASTELYGSDLYITGQTSDTINFDGNILYGSQAIKYHYLAKLDLSPSTPVYTKATKIEAYLGNMVVNDLMMMPDGDELFVLGNSWASLNYYYSSSGGSINVSNAGNPSGIFLAKYDDNLNTSSNTAWPVHYTGTGSSTTTYSGSLALDYINCGVMYSGSFAGGDLNVGYNAPFSTPATDPGCSTTVQSDMFVARALPTSRVSYKSGLETEEQLVEQEINVYPNPAHNKVHISGVEAGAFVSLISAQGQVLQTYKANGSEMEIVRGNYAPGLYFLRVEQGRKQQVLRFLFD
jgi:hypothetical protein